MIIGSGGFKFLDKTLNLAYFKGELEVYQEQVRQVEIYYVSGKAEKAEAPIKKIWSKSPLCFSRDSDFVDNCGRSHFLLSAF